MSGILPAHLRDLIIRPTLVEMGHYSPAAEALLLGTAAHESHGGRYLSQIRGPARGIYQMEPATHDDLWRHYLPPRRPPGVSARPGDAVMAAYVIPPTAWCGNCGSVLMRDAAGCPFCAAPPAPRPDDDQAVRDLVAAARRADLADALGRVPALSSKPAAAAPTAAEYNALRDDVRRMYEALSLIAQALRGN